MRKKLLSLFLCSFLCLCAASCGHDNNGQVAVSGEDYEYHLYNTHTAATEDYLLARTAMGDTYLIPTSDNTRMEGSCQLDIDLNLFCGFDIGGDTVFFTNKGKVYSIKIDDLVTKAIHGNPILENLEPAVDGSFPKYKDGKLYVTDTPEEKLDSTYNLGELKKHTTSVYDVTESPWELVEQGTDILYPEYNQPDLSKAQVQLDDEIKEHTTGWYNIPHSADNPFTFISNYDDQWIYYMIPHTSAVLRTPYSSSKFDETMHEWITECFPQMIVYRPYRVQGSEVAEEDRGYAYFDIIDQWIYYATTDKGIYKVNRQNLGGNATKVIAGVSE